MDMEAAMYVPEMPKVSTSNYNNDVMSSEDSSEYGSYGSYGSYGEGSEQKEEMIDERFMSKLQ